MQTPEEYLRDLLVGYCEVWGKPGHEWCIHGRAPEGICPRGHSALALIRARDAEVRAEARAKVLVEYHRFTSAVGFGDNVTEPAATPEELIDPIMRTLSDAQEHIECAVTCEYCGEPLARETCQHCHGAGCGPGSHDECEWCAGVGKVHPECVGRSYVELAADAATLAGFEREDVGPFHGHGFTEPGYWRLVGPKHYKPLPEPPTDAEVKALFEHLGITEPEP